MHYCEDLPGLFLKGFFGSFDALESALGHRGRDLTGSHPVRPYRQADRCDLERFDAEATRLECEMKGRQEGEFMPTVNLIEGAMVASAPQGRGSWKRVKRTVVFHFRWRHRTQTYAETISVYGMSGMLDRN